jgi:hypothetical protein
MLAWAGSEELNLTSCPARQAVLRLRAGRWQPEPARAAMDLRPSQTISFKDLAEERGEAHGES